jgi:superfamily II DNA/RNA helicase
MIACAQTGTGKTAAYLLPLINKISQKSQEGINAIVIAPTRELARQIDQQMEGFSYFVSVSSLAIYGGSDGDTYVREKKALKKGADVIIATPGKLLSHLRQGYCPVGQLQYLVLDEADRMLDMGFYPDIMEIISHMPKERQTLLFSATMPPKIRKLAGEILRDPVQVDIAVSKPAANAVQAVFLIEDSHKVKLVQYLLRDNDVPSVIIFASTKRKVKDVLSALLDKGLQAEAIHSDLEQHEREKVLNKFKAGQCTILVATDIVSRGIDIESIAMVINYDAPHDPEDYIHRIGRTARAGAEGEAITFVSSRDQKKLYQIEQFLEKEIRKVALPKHIPAGTPYKPNSFQQGDRRKHHRKR